MIGKNWIKVLTGTAVAAVLPLVSSASTHYTGKIPAGIAMMATSTPDPVKKVSSHHKLKKVVHHTSVKKASLKTSKHSLHKKHLALTAKKKRTI
jgi:hypothetical protein